MAGIGKEQRLTARQQRAVRVLLTARNVTEAARTAGIGERTLYRWLDDPAFRSALMEAEANALDVATRRLTTLADSAVDALQRVLADPTVGAPVRVRAAEVVLGQLLKLREVRDLEQRLMVLEATWHAK